MKKMSKQLLALLAVSILLVSLAHAEGLQVGKVEKSTAVVTKYPPYPDVWDWVTPDSGRMSYRFQAELLPNGDVRLSYQLKSKSSKPNEDINPQGEKQSALLFGQKSVTSMEDVDAYHNKWRVVLPNGKIIMSPGLGGDRRQLFSAI